MARPTNTLQRRAQIVQGLLRVMAQNGYERASVIDIAREAGLTPGLVHYHFRSKQEILVSLVDYLHGRVRERHRKILKAGSSPRARLEAFLDARVARRADDDPDAVACWVAIAAEAVRQPEVQQVYRRAVAGELDELTRLLEEALASARRPHTGAREMAAALLAAIQGAYQLATAAPGTTPRGFAAASLRHIIEGLLGPRSPSRPRPRARAP